MSSIRPADVTCGSASPGRASWTRPSTGWYVMSGGLGSRSQLRPALRSPVDARCVLVGPADALAQSASRGEIRAAHWTRLYVPQDLVIRLCEELLGEKRIGQFAN